MSSAIAALAGLLTLAPVTDQDADAAAFVGDSGGISVYDFEDDAVDGEVLSPEGANINSRGKIRHASMLTLRPHFIAELHRLTLDL